jgi:hypothetical protein
MTAGDSAMALTLLKILEKHKLVTKTSSPQLMCQIGQPATVEVTAAGNANDVFRVSVGTRRLDESDVVLEIIARDGTHERRSEVLVSARERKTIIMKLQPRTGGKKGNAEPAKYVFVTPEFVADQLGGWMRP